jgi:hypothetical protein
MYKIFGENIVAVAFQSAFYLEMHQNNIFFILKKLFLISAHQIYLKTLKIYQFEAKKKNSKFFKCTFKMQKQTWFYETQLKKYVKTTS